MPRFRATTIPGFYAPGYDDEFDGAASGGALLQAPVAQVHPGYSGGGDAGDAGAGGGADYYGPPLSRRQMRRNASAMNQFDAIRGRRERNLAWQEAKDAAGGGILDPTGLARARRYMADALSGGVYLGQDLARGADYRASALTGANVRGIDARTRGINAQTDDFILGAPLARERYRGETAHLERMYPQVERGAQLGNDQAGIRNQFLGPQLRQEWDAGQEAIQGQQQTRRQQQEAFDAQRWALPAMPALPFMQGQTVSGLDTVVMPPGAEDLRRAFVNRALGRPVDAPIATGGGNGATAAAPLPLPGDAQTPTPRQTAGGGAPAAGPQQLQLPQGMVANGDGTYTNAATGTKFRIVNGRFVRA